MFSFVIVPGLPGCSRGRLPNRKLVFLNIFVELELKLNPIGKYKPIRLVTTRTRDECLVPWWLWLGTATSCLLQYGSPTRLPGWPWAQPALGQYQTTDLQGRPGYWPTDYSKDKSGCDCESGMRIEFRKWCSLHTRVSRSSCPRPRLVFWLGPSRFRLRYALNLFPSPLSMGLGL